MKTMLMRASMLAVLFAGANLMAQEATTSMRDYLAPEKSTRNVFEDPKIASPEYDGVKVTVGGDFALQFQAVDHWTENKNLGAVSYTHLDVYKRQVLQFGNDAVQGFLSGLQRTIECKNCRHSKMFESFRETQ